MNDAQARERLSRELGEQDAEIERLRKALRIIAAAHGPLRFDDEADEAFVRETLCRSTGGECPTRDLCADSEGCSWPTSLTERKPEWVELSDGTKSHPMISVAEYNAVVDQLAVECEAKHVARQQRGILEADLAMLHDLRERDGWSINQLTAEVARLRAGKPAFDEEGER